MTLLELPKRERRGWWHLLPRQPGWIGVDIGSRAIKLAQVVCDGTTFRIRARWTLSANQDAILSREEIGNGALSRRALEIKSLRRMFSGRECAAVLPMSLVDMRSLEIPMGDVKEQRLMVAEELAADLGKEPGELTFDFWKTASDGDETAGLTRISALALPYEITVRVANDLLAGGLECQTLNGLPCALARAVDIVDPAQTDEPVAAIDLGYTSATFVIVKGGHPLFSRTLRGGSLQSMMQPLESGLKLSSEECQQLLVRYGVPAAGTAVSPGARTTSRLIAHPLDILVSEIDRTVGYVAQQFRELKPLRLWLFGGGATIHNLAEHLSEKLQIAATPWTAGGDGSDPSDARYGVAAALSTLFWEDRTCI